MKVLALLVNLSLIGSCSAFTVQPSAEQRSATSLTAMGRRQFFEAGSAAVLIGSMPAFALDDLAEPTAEEKEAAEVGWGNRVLSCRR